MAAFPLRTDDEDRRPIVTVIDDALSRLLGRTSGAILFGSANRSSVARSGSHLAGGKPET